MKPNFPSDLSIEILFFFCTTNNFSYFQISDILFLINLPISSTIFALLLLTVGYY